MSILKNMQFYKYNKPIISNESTKKRMFFTDDSTILCGIKTTSIFNKHSQEVL